MRCFAILLSLLIFTFTQPAGQNAKKDTKTAKEQEDNYFKEWLNEDVVYIITPEETAVFQKLSTPEEKENFIEQFWARRDPDPSMANNEFKEEHYRRIAYANERFASGFPGWKTDRGKIYIKFGPPDEIQSHPSGGSYNRAPYEGGGSTATFPFEVWRYRHIDGIGDDIEIEFVDKTHSGEYKIALYPDEKDALLYVPGAGLTMSEMLGRRSKADRAIFNVSKYTDPAYQVEEGMRAKDAPFERLMQLVNLQRPPQIRFADLKQVVETNITYQLFPFRVSHDLIRLSPEQCLVPLNVEISNHDLTYKALENGYSGATANIYGRITGLGGKTVQEFDDVVSVDAVPATLEQNKKQKSMYQRMLLLAPGLYKLDLVIKDLHSGKIGTIQSRISVPSGNDPSKLGTSSLILARSIRQVGVPKVFEQFILGDLKVIPNVEREFQPSDPLNVYLQVYNVAVDPKELKPSVGVTYEITAGDKVIQQVIDDHGASVEFFSGQRVVLVKALPIAELKEGSYRVRVSIRDKIGNKEVIAEAPFQVKGS
ncbi:MAG: GWxTD domain-containing protein [Acidobacteria bacterium]|nr:GWxTD domain-containing protein [Acidobacteriota bacterium]